MASHLGLSAFQLTWLKPLKFLFGMFLRTQATEVIVNDLTGHVRPTQKPPGHMRITSSVYKRRENPIAEPQFMTHFFKPSQRL